MYDTIIQTRCWSTDGRPGVKNWYFKNKPDALAGKRRLELCGFEIVNEFNLVQKENECPSKQKPSNKN